MFSVVEVAGLSFCSSAKGFYNSPTKISRQLKKIIICCFRNTMMRLNMSPYFPKQLYKDPVYGIVARNTLLGFHRQSNRRDIDQDCSKTTLLVGKDRITTEKLVQLLGKQPSWNMVTDGNIMDTLSVPNAPMNIEQFYFADLEKICSFHHFDMYITYNIDANEFAQSLILNLEGYEHVTNDPPQRSIVERYMRDMLY